MRSATMQTPHDSWLDPTEFEEGPEDFCPACAGEDFYGECVVCHTFRVDTTPEEDDDCY